MDMKNQFLLVASFIFFAFASSNAQVGISIASGLNVSNCKFTNYETLSPSTRTDYFLSLAPSYQLNEKFRLLVDFQYSRKGFVFGYTNSPTTSEDSYSYLDIIPQIEYKLHQFFAIGLGVNYAFVVNEENKNEKGNWINTKKLEIIKQSDFGIIGKIKGEYKNIFCFVSYNLGLKNIVNSDYSNENGKTVAVSQFNRNLQIGLGYTFNFKKSK
jgi:predicted porin